MNKKLNRQSIVSLNLNVVVVVVFFSVNSEIMFTLEIEWIIEINLLFFLWPCNQKC